MYEVKTSSRHKNNKLRWLTTDVGLNCYTLGVLSLMDIRGMGHVWYITVKFWSTNPEIA